MTLTEIAVIVFGLLIGYWVVSKLVFPPSKAAPQQPPAPKDPPQTRWHDILEIPPSASELQIRDAYKRLISKYHPDKVDNLGQELKDLAARKSQEITAAYQQGMRERGASP